MNFLLFGKKPTKNTIRKAAEHLMAIYGSTTTLEVKKYLRALGYGAFQSDISDKMDDLYLDCGWKFTFNGQFRVYFKPQDDFSYQAKKATSIPSFSLNGLFV
jgi:hypothetical protein